MLRKYNYNLETGTVGSDDDNIANLYNINRMEMKVNFSTSDLDKLEKPLGELYFMTSDMKVHLNRFMGVYGEKVDGDTFTAIATAIDEAMEMADKAIEDSCDEEPETQKICEVFPAVYRKLLAIVPTVLLMDDQSTGRAPIKKDSLPSEPDDDLHDEAIVKEIMRGKKRDLMFNGRKWLVLYVKDGMALILTEDITENRAYHTNEEGELARESSFKFPFPTGADSLPGVTWETCDLRQYLNGEFLQTFSKEQQERIAETKINTPDNLWYGTAGGNDTLDRIFLLSLEEADLYFGNSKNYLKRKSSSRGQWGIPKKDDNGTFVSNAHDRNREATMISQWGDRRAESWWLRSSGFKSMYVALVDSHGTATGLGGCIEVKGTLYYSRYEGVRPALWLRL